MVVLFSGSLFGVFGGVSRMKPYIKPDLELIILAGDVIETSCVTYCGEGDTIELPEIPGT